MAAAEARRRQRLRPWHPIVAIAPLGVVAVGVLYIAPLVPCHPCDREGAPHSDLPAPLDRELAEQRYAAG